MAETPTRSIITKEIGSCPCCGKPLVARVAMDLTMGNLSHDATVDVTAKPIGLEVAHDCLPKTTRDLGPQTPAPFRSTTTPERTTP